VFTRRPIAALPASIAALVPMVLIAAGTASAQTLVRHATNDGQHWGKAVAVTPAVGLATASRTARLPPPAKATDAPRAHGSAFPVTWSTRASSGSKRKATLIGLLIGSGVGVAGGVYASQATGGDTDPWGIPMFGAIGAGAGALTGLLIALF
jgi:hypothetical protein